MTNTDTENHTKPCNSRTYNTQNLRESLRIIAQDFNTKTSNLDMIHNVVFKISSSIGTKLNETSFSHHFETDHSALISFESTIGKLESKIFWKLSGSEEFKYLDLNHVCSEALLDFCRWFLVEEVKKEKCGILKSSQSKEIIEIHDIGNEENQNLLTIAVMQNNLEIVETLLALKLDVDHEDDKQIWAIEKAWTNYSNSKDTAEKERTNKIIMSLLKANSPLPFGDFAYETASKDVQEFIDMCEDVHKAVENGCYVLLKTQLKLNPNLRHFYNREGTSLISNTTISKDANKLNQLFALGLSPGYYEDIEKIYSNIDSKFHSYVRKQHEVSAKQMPKVHLSVLKQKSKIGGNDWKHDERWKYIEDAYEVLNQNKICSKILKVVAAWNNLQIIFDFKQDTVYYLDPTNPGSVRGVAYNSGKIYIGAKYLMQPERKFSVIGVMVHELCHFAVLITFMNNFDPYPMGESEAKRRFERIVVIECEKNKQFEPMVLNVFNSYRNEHQHSELIVLVVQMIMHYYIKDPNAECKNSKKMQELDVKYGELFKYFKEIVESEFEKAVKMLKILQDTSQKLSFCNLTEPMKAKLLNSKINFQEQETTFYGITENDLEVLNSIPSKTIRDVILRNPKIHISQTSTKSVKFKIIERKFLNQEILVKGLNNPIWKNIENSQNQLKLIMKIADKLKMFILSDTAGAGKTTTFVDLAKKLKMEYKNYWVVYIKLRSYQGIFEEYQKIDEKLSKEKVFEIISKIVDLKSEMEIKIFTKLFNENKAILLFDGIDEICPKFNHLIIEIIDILKQSTRNQLWISTRPQHATQLDQKFKVPIYKFQPYTEDDIEEFILEILKDLLPQQEENQNQSLQFLKTFLKSIEESFSSKEYSVNNPLMIEVITELYVSNKINLQTTNMNLFGVFNQIADKQIEKIDEKIQHGDRRSFMKISIENIHEIFAVQFLFKNFYEKMKLENLSVVKNWKKIQHQWTSEKIQRYGFMTVDLDDQTQIDFMHRTYAEFFLTNLIVTHIFSDSTHVTNEDRGLIFHLFLMIIKQRFFYGFIIELLLSYIKNAARNNSLIIPQYVKKLFIKEIPNVQDEIFKSANQKGSDDGGSPKPSKFAGLVRKFFGNLISQKTHQTLSEEESSSFDGIDTDDDGNNHYVYAEISESDDEVFVGNDKNDEKCVMQTDESITNIKYLELFCYLIKIEQQQIDNLWMINRTENLVSKILNSNLICNYESLKNVLEILEFCFGSNFHKIIAKFIRNMVTDEDIKSLAEGTEISKFSINLLKLLDLIKKCYKIDSIRSINAKILHNCLVLDHVENEIQMKVFLDISEVFRSIKKDFLNFLVMSTEISSMNVCKYIGDNIEEFLNNDENDIKKFLSYKYSGENHPLIKSLHNNRADVFKIYKDLLTKYSISSDTIQSKFLTCCDLSNLFFTMNDETYEEFKNFMIDNYLTFKDVIFQFPAYHKIKSDGIAKAFEFFEDFSSTFFDNDVKQTRNFIPKVFPFSDSDESHPLIESAKLDSKDMLVVYKNLFTKYLYTAKELKSIFICFCYIPEIILCIQPQVYPEFKNLVKEIFNSNKLTIYACIKDGVEMTKRSSTGYTESICFSVYEESSNKLKKIRRSNLVGQRDLEESMKYWIKSELLSIQSKIKLFTDLILFLFEDNQVIGWELINKSFFQDRQIWDYLFLKCIDTNYWLKIEIITNSQKLELFEEISLCYCTGDKIESRNFIRKMLFYDNNPDYHSLLRVIKLKNLEKFKGFKNFYIKYKNSWEELQNIFVSFCDLSRIFLDVTDEIYLELKDLLLDAFVTNKDKIFECIDKNSWMYFHPDTTIKMFKNLENFSSVLFLNDKSKFKEFMRLIVFHKHWINYHPLIQSTLSKTVDEFLFYKNLCLKYMNSKEEMQEYLLKWKYIPHVLIQAEPKIYSQFMLFIKEIFDSDIQKIKNFCENFICCNSNSVNIEENTLFVQGIQSSIALDFFLNK